MASVFTAALYKAYAGISASTYDTRIASLILAVVNEAELWCGRTFDTATFTEKADGSGTDCMVVRNGPITSITSITVYTGSDSEVLESTSYTFSAGEDARIWLYGGASGYRGIDGDGLNPRWGTSPCFPMGRGNVWIVYVGGYGTAAATVPPSLLDAVWETVSERLALSTAAGGGATAGAALGLLSSKTLGSNSESYRDPKATRARFYERFGPFKRQVYG